MFVKVIEVNVRYSFAGSYISLELENPIIRTVHKLRRVQVKCHAMSITNKTWDKKEIHNPVLDEAHVEHVLNELLLIGKYDPSVALA